MFPNVCNKEKEVASEIIQVTKSRWNGTKELVARTLVVDCSDGRLPDARADLLVPPFAVGRHCPLLVPGGPGALVSPALSSATEEWMWGWIKMLHGANGFERVIAIAHHDCKYYGHAHPEKNKKELLEIQSRELVGFADKISRIIPSVTIETLYAEPAACGHTQYRRIRP